MADIPHIDALTAQDVASVLQVNKNTVYGLAKAGTLPSYNVGRKLRFSLDDVQAFIDASRNGRQQPGSPTGIRPVADGGGDSITSGAFVIGGHDMTLDILANYLSATGIPALRSYRSSYQELADLYLGKVDAAAIHLWDSETDSYNLPYVKRLAPGIPLVVLQLATRSQGLLVRRGNPLGLRDWSDLVHRPIVLANRERGSGSRVLLDEHLRLLEADAHAINGYEREILSDLAQGALIAHGGADVGIGTERVFRQVPGLDYRPLQTETIALVIAKTPSLRRIIRTVRGLLGSGTFRRELVALSGYDFSHLGDRLYET
jgi:putative molybdopterin biosynthesis protein